jgi:hypothetical protein
MNGIVTILIGHLPVTHPQIATITQSNPEIKAKFSPVKSGVKSEYELDIGS